MMKTLTASSTLPGWLSPPTFADPELNRKAKLLNQVLLITILLSPLYMLVMVFVVPGSGSKLFADAILLCAMFVMYALLKLGYVRWVAALLLGTFWAYITVVLILFGGIRNPIVVGFSAIVIMAGILIGSRGVIFTIVASSASTFLLAWLERSGRLPPSLLELSDNYIWTATIVMLVATGAILYLYGFSIDEALGRAVQSEEIATSSEKQLRDLINTVEGIVWEADPKTFEFTFVSAQAEKLLGYPTQDWLHDVAFWPSRIHPDDREQAINDCMTSVNQLQDITFEYRMQAKDGSYKWVRDFVTVLAEDRKPIKLRGIIVDITRQKALEEQVRLSEKMDVVGQLTAGIAHDFNNLLTSINVSAQLIQLKLGKEDDLQKKVDRILDSSQHATNLVRQLMSFSRKQIVEPAILDINRSIMQLTSVLKHTIGGHIDLRCYLADDLWPIIADPSQLEQILMNLLLNARDAMPTEGRLTITTENMVIQAAHSSWIGAPAGDYILLKVSDTGHGINPGDQERIFEPFYTTKGVGQGTGLGLSTVARIVEQNNGKIQVESDSGVGTTFSILLPRSEHIEKETPDTKTPKLHQASSETILLVEDTIEVREGIEESLTLQGYQVLTACNGIEAIEVAATYGKKIDLLLTDVVMPGMGGKALAQQFRKERPDTKILFMSGYTDNAINNNELLEPGLQFIQKPFSHEALLARVQEVIELPKGRQVPATYKPLRKYPFIRIDKNETSAENSRNDD